jgi:dihydroorotate dehydrogenase electron transfer subunit
MKELNAKIIYNRSYKGLFYKLGLECEIKDYVPGQFVMIEVQGQGLLLRRPFGIARIGDGVAEICYKVVGQGTRALSKVPQGATLSVIGPLGNGFNVGAACGKTALLIAGGYGIAPLLGLAEALILGKGAEKVQLIYGAKGEGQLIYLEAFEKMGVETEITTEDGSAATKGLATDLIKKHIGQKDLVVYSCGPAPMLEQVQKSFRGKGVSCQLSLESHMACGFGVCLGCVVEKKNGEMVRICTEGPVFEASELGRSPLLRG